MDKMNIEEFKNELLKTLSEKLGDDYRVFTRTNVKNNGVKIEGITASYKDGNTSMPIIYFEDSYSLYENGKETIDSLADYFISKIGSVEHGIKYLNLFNSIDNIKSNIRYKVINKSKNSEMLEEHPYVGLLDLAKIFVIDNIDSNHDHFEVKINNSHLKALNISVDQLEKYADQNMLNNGKFKVINIEEFIRRKTLDNSDCSYTQKETFNVIDRKDDAGMKMYTCTNAASSCGAEVLAYPEFLTELGEYMGGSYFVFPSSIHEIIVVPESDDFDTESATRMIRDINKNVVSEEDYLSDTLYYFDNKLKKLVYV